MDTRDLLEDAYREATWAVNDLLIDLKLALAVLENRFAGARLHRGRGGLDHERGARVGYRRSGGLVRFSEVLPRGKLEVGGEQFSDRGQVDQGLL